MKTIFSALLLLIISIPALPQTQPLFTYETVKVAGGVYAFIAHQPGAALFSGNSVAIIGDDAVLVVDSGQFPSLTKKMIGEIRSLTDKPVRVLVNTHWHGDHNTGNVAYQEAFPGIAIVSTAETRANSFTLREKALVAKQIAAFAPVVKTSLATGRTPDGKPLDASTRAEFQRLQPEFDFALPELKEVRSVAPNQTFNDKATFYLGNREVQVMFLGRGNTAGDAVIYVPDAKVLITGDLVVAPIPFAHGAFITEWIDTLKQLQSLDSQIIVPGHGPVQHDKSYIALVSDALTEISAQGQRAVKEGMSLEAATKQITLPDFQKRFAADDPSLNAAFSKFFLIPALRRAYREAKEGKLNDENF